MESEKYVAKSLMQLSHRMRRYLDSETARCGTTHMQSMILHYLRRNGEREIYQRDIESEFGIRRSSVTSVLQLMEKNGLIERKSVKSDARLKQIIITPAGTDIDTRVSERLREADRRIGAEFTDSEMMQLDYLFDKINTTLDAMEK